VPSGTDPEAGPDELLDLLVESSDLVYILDVAKTPVTEVNVHEAKTHLSRLLARVQAGETITIAKAGKPVAKLVPVGSRRPDRVLGRDAGRVWIADDFDAPLPDELLAGFEG
jgi:prevent-host-death family protein